jgi:hypothetical protein
MNLLSSEPKPAKYHSCPPLNFNDRSKQEQEPPGVEVIEFGFGLLSRMRCGSEPILLLSATSVAFFQKNQSFSARKPCAFVREFLPKKTKDFERIKAFLPFRLLVFTEKKHYYGLVEFR